MDGKHGHTAGSLGGKARALKLSRERRREIARKAALARWGGRGDLMGVVDEGEELRAEVIIGLRVGKPLPGSLVQQKGVLLGEEEAINAFFALRAKQVGHRNAAATITRCEGRWMGQREPVIACEIEHIPIPGREGKPETFKAHILKLAEEAAEKFGQEEVFVRMGGRTYRANAPGARLAPARPGGRVVR